MIEKVREEDVHAYIDRELDAGESRRIEAWLEREPDVARAAQAYREQGALLHAAFDGILDEPLPRQLNRPVVRRQRALRAAMAFSWLLVGGIAGWSLHELDTPAPVAGLPHHAVVAHAVFVPEVRHPVEVRAAEEAHLVGWLSKRLGIPIRAPKLAAHGFELLGGRLLPASARPGAQLMYQDAAGRRLTLYLSTDVDNRDSAFRYTREGSVHVFYWIDRNIGYALSGELDKAEMLGVARTIYEQLNP